MSSFLALLSVITKEMTTFVVMNIYRAKLSLNTKLSIGMTTGILLFITAIGVWKGQLWECLRGAPIIPAIMLPIGYIFYLNERCVALTNKTIRIVRAHNTKVELEFLLSDIELLAFEKVPLQGYRMGIKIGREMDVHDLWCVETPQAKRLIRDLENRGVQVILSD